MRRKYTDVADGTNDHHYGREPAERERKISNDTDCGTFKHRDSVDGGAIQAHLKGHHGGRVCIQIR